MDDMEGRVEAYDIGARKDLRGEFDSLEHQESVEKALDEIKRRVSGDGPGAGRRTESPWPK
jgi:phage shock protein A